jgi:NADH:ubiquinone oxidoreductase subunit 6 (subunit J)
MTETVLFSVGALIALFGAVIMLISRNAVHSALGLVVTMGALAFLFLLLDAPFLAMIQITVYAGAIMVLFIFVIMLLGSEQIDLRDRKFPWFPAVGVTLAMALVLAIALPILSNQLNTREIPLPAPQVRVIHAATDVPAVTVALDALTVAEGLEFSEASSFADIAAGDYTVTVTPEGGAPLTTNISLAAGTATSIIAYGTGANVQFGIVSDDLSTVTESRSSRLVVFNAYAPETNISLVDFGSEFDENDTGTLVNDLPYGTASEAFYIEEGTQDWSYIIGAGASDVNPDINNIVVRTREFEVDRDQAELLVVTGRRDMTTDTVSGAVVPVSVEARPSFGGPRAIGILLFTEYMLPMQLLAVLLLAAMVGAIVLTHRHVEPTKKRTNVRRRVARPLTNVLASQVGHDVVQEDAPQLPATTEQRETSGD